MKQRGDFALPPAAYVGGKKLLARRICAQIEAIPHRSYIEPFVGMGGVFFRRRVVAAHEVINDYNGDVANLFRILQRHFVPLMDMLRWQVTSREHFERLRATPAASLTDLERAVRFLYVQRLAFGGAVRRPNFNASAGSARFDVLKLLPALEAIHERLASVTIECLPYERLIARYDRADALFYLDPPYWGTEDYYDAPFGREDFTQLAQILRGIDGAFLLSINDCAEVREVFDGFEMMDVATRYADRQSGGTGRVRGELVVSNRPLREV